MFKLNPLPLAFGILLAFAATTGQAAEPFKRTVDDRKAEVAKLASTYKADRKEYASEMLELHQNDTGEVLAGRGLYDPKPTKGQLDGLYKKEIIFSTTKADPTSLRAVGMAADLGPGKDADLYWVMTNRTPKEFEASFGQPVYSVPMDQGTCKPTYWLMGSTYYEGYRAMWTYLDLDKSGNPVEIYVKTCTYSKGPYEGQSVITDITPAMQSVNFQARQADVQKRVYKNYRKPLGNNTYYNNEDKLNNKDYYKVQ